jgi:hypothetical protein
MHTSSTISLLSGIVSVFQLLSSLVTFVFSIQNVKSRTAHAFSSKLIFVLHDVESPRSILFFLVHKFPSLHVSIEILKSLLFKDSLFLGVFLLAHLSIVRCEVLLVTVGGGHIVAGGGLR